jgi:hypothetical protein
MASRLLLVSMPGCSLVSDFNVHQCASNADCRALTGDALRCEESRCVAGCQSNSECVALDPRRPICPYSGGTCASLTSGEVCPISSAYDDASMGPLTGADLMLIGGFAPSFRSPTWLSAQLAIDELNAARVSGTEKARPAIMILCDDSPDASRDAMDHLVLDLGAHAVLATQSNESVQRALTHAPTAGQAVFLVPGSLPLGANAEVATGSLPWYLGGNQSDVARAFPALTRLLLPAVGAAAGELPRLASIVGPDSEDKLLAGALESSLEVQGLDFQELRRRGTYIRADLQEPPGADDLRSQLSDIVTGEGPQLVWVFLGPRLAEPALTTLEQELSTSGAAEPFYVLGPRSHHDPALRSFTTRSASFADRAMGIDALRSSDPNVLEPLQARYSTAFPEAIPAGGASYELAPTVYDAMYYLAYALSHASSAASVPGASASATAIADGLRAVTQPSGSPVTVGPDGLDVALPLLSRGEPLNVIGTTGAADFESQLQIRSAPAALFCWQSDGALRELGKVVSSGADFEVVGAACARSLLDAP